MYTYYNLNRSALSPVVQVCFNKYQKVEVSFALKKRLLSTVKDLQIYKTNMNTGRRRMRRISKHQGELSVDSSISQQSRVRTELLIT